MTCPRNLQLDFQPSDKLKPDWLLVGDEMFRVTFRNQRQRAEQRAQVLLHALCGQLAVAGIDGLDDARVLVGQLWHRRRRIKGQETHAVHLRLDAFGDAPHVIAASMQGE